MDYIAYYRVSTKKQGISGLGLDAQKESVERYIAPERIGAEFIEIETGTSKKDRPILKKALELCKKEGATLLIAKLDRLARNVSFVSSLMESGVKFKAVDFPEANELTIHILSAIAQHEATIIGSRIKDALSIKKQRLALEGKKLGTPGNLTDSDRAKGVIATKLKARSNPNNQRARAFCQVKINQKYTLWSLSNDLNNANFKTSRGKEFTPTQVKRLIDSI